LIPILSTFLPTVSVAAEEEATNRPFESNAFHKAELTNSIIASRDTNVSPMEVYDTLRSQLRRNANVTGARALDVGAGAGVSTQVLYQQLGYQTIDAVDWSGVAWQTNVVEAGYCPPTVHFYELDDERFLREWRRQGSVPYDVIVFNFAVNKEKALYFCRNLLKPDGLLLAPINIQKDYWLKQSYQLLDSDGRVKWNANDVGAWSVLFQPDVTQDTCQGIWCAPFNGFEKLRVYSGN
jgi:SAM-dependent methyltransferase